MKNSHPSQHKTKKHEDKNKDDKDAYKKKNL
jgi:hypothetical protein